eukprot:scaffold20688_cov65-Phaeocystis_antarctica.AAC.5
MRAPPAPAWARVQISPGCHSSRRSAGSRGVARGWLEPRRRSSRRQSRSCCTRLRRANPLLAAWRTVPPSTARPERSCSAGRSWRCPGCAVGCPQRDDPALRARPGPTPRGHGVRAAAWPPSRLQGCAFLVARLVVRAQTLIFGESKGTSSTSELLRLVVELQLSNEFLLILPKHSESGSANDWWPRVPPPPAAALRRVPAVHVASTVPAAPVAYLPPRARLPTSPCPLSPRLSRAAQRGSALDEVVPEAGSVVVRLVVLHACKLTYSLTTKTTILLPYYQDHLLTY